MEFEERQKNEFNMSLLWLNRINVCLWTILDAKQNHNANGYYSGIRELFGEIITELKDKERQEYQDKINKLYIQIAVLNKKIMRTGKQEIPQQIFWHLFEIETKFKDVLKDSGLLTKIQDDALNALK